MAGSKEQLGCKPKAAAAQAIGKSRWSVPLRVEVVEHGRTKNGVNGDIQTKSKGNGDAERAGSTHVQGAASNDLSEIAVAGSVEIGGTTNGTTKFDGSKWIGIIKHDELSDKAWLLRLEPKMEQQAAGVQSTACVHDKAAQLDERTQCPS